MNEPLVSIVITNYNDLEYIKGCLDSLDNLTYKNFEIIFVDNNSSDNSVAFVRNNYKNVKVIRNKKNYGVSSSNNIGASQTKGKYIVLLNVDTVVDKNWLSEFIKVAQASPKVGIVGCKQFDFDNRDMLSFGGSASDKFGRVSEFGSKKKDKGLFNIQMKSFFVTGAGLLFKRELFERIQLFDPSYYMYYEDVDFCWRAWIYGYDVIYSPKPILYHKINKPNKFENRYHYIYYVERNRLRTILKNYELKNLFHILPIYFYKRLRFIFKIYSNDKKLFSFLFGSLLRAIVWNLLKIKSMIKYRTNIQANRKRDDKFIFNLMENLTKLKKKLNGDVDLNPP